MGLLFWKALAGLLFYDVLIHCRDLSTVLSVVDRWKVAASTTPEIEKRACAALKNACVFYPKRVLCLQRSAVGACLLRQCGINAKMVVGVRVMPLLAHAWIEVNGKVVGDLPRVQQYYRPLTSH